MIERHGELGFEEVNVMIIEDVWFELKDGRKALLRSPKEEDIESTLEYLVISAKETEYILRYQIGRAHV